MDDFKFSKNVYLEKGTVCINHSGKLFMFDYKYSPNIGELVVTVGELSPFIEDFKKLFNFTSIKFIDYED